MYYPFNILSHSLYSIYSITCVGEIHEASIGIASISSKLERGVIRT